MVFFLDYLFFRVLRLPPTTALLLRAALLLSAAATTSAYSLPFGVFSRSPRISSTLVTSLVTCSVTSLVTSLVTFGFLPYGSPQACILCNLDSFLDDASFIKAEASFKPGGGVVTGLGIRLGNFVTDVM